MDISPRTSQSLVDGRVAGWRRSLVCLATMVLATGVVGTSTDRQARAEWAATSASPGGPPIPSTAPSASARPAAELDAVLADLAKARAGIRTLQGPFDQVRTVSLLAQRVRSKGRLWLQRPGQLRWSLEPPDDAVYWVTPAVLAYRTPAGTGRVARGAPGPLGGVLGDLLVLLGDDLGLLRARYDFALIRRDEHAVVLHATPRDPAVLRTTKRIELEFDRPSSASAPGGPDLSVLSRVVLVERGADRSEITFGTLTKNGPIDPDLLNPP